MTPGTGTGDGGVALKATKLDEILGFIRAGSQWAALVPGGAAVSAIAGSLLSIIQAAVQAHEAVTGEPLDLSKLHELPHVD